MSKNRELAFELMDDEHVAPHHMVVCCLKYMSDDDIEKMLKANDIMPGYGSWVYGDEDE